MTPTKKCLAECYVIGIKYRCAKEPKHTGLHEWREKTAYSLQTTLKWGDD